MQLTAYGKGLLHSIKEHAPGDSKMWLGMKLTVILLMAAILQGNAKSYSQNITLSLRNAPLEKVLSEIKKQSGYHIIYGKGEMARTTNVDVNVVNASVESVLSLVFKGQPLSYSISDKFIIIAPRTPGPRPEDPSALPLPPIDFFGRVRDENGNVMAGITVTVKGTKLITATDERGEFSLKGIDGNAVLILTGVNIETTEVAIKNAGMLIKVKAKTSQLDEVQIIGYGSTTRRRSTGSISSVSSDDIAKQNITNPITALQGRIAGAVITQDNGLMGSAVRVSIRGAGSGVSMAGYVPLYIVDGVPFTLFNGGFPATDNLNAYGISGANGGISPLSMINPEDIERIDVLKDADATAIYGSRGGNGVIIITTKKGGQNRTVFNLNANHGISKINHFIPMMSTQEYLAMRKEAFSNAGVTPTAANALDLTVWNQTANTDWQKWAIGGTAHNTNATASVSGGNAQTRFLYSSTYRTEGTVYPGSFNNNMFSNRINAGHTTKDGKFNINLSVAYSAMKNNLPSVDLSSIYNLPPNFPLYNSDGSVNFTLTSPLAYLMKKYDGSVSNLIGNLLLSYELVPGLKLKANLGYSTTGLSQTSTNPAAAQNSASSTVSMLNYAKNDNTHYTVEPQIEYSRMVSKGRLGLLVGSTFQQDKATGISMQGVGFSNDNLITSLTAANTITVVSNNYSLYKYNALFGKVNYSWENKYILDATGRRDGSSRFGAGHRFGNFGAVGAAWIFTEEQFARNLHFLSSGKLRGSYGITGNDQIMNYQYFSVYTATAGYNYNGSSILFPSNLANPDLHWEKTTKLDLALELGFFKDRILLKTDFYRNLSTDVLTFITTPTQSGVNSYMGNLPAVIENKGLEIELNTTNINTGKFRWTTFLNLTIPRNKLLSYPGLAVSSYSTTYEIGKPANLQKFYQFEGVDPKNGQPTFKDQNGDGQMTYAADRVAANFGHPIYGGFGNSISYDGLSLDFVFQFNHRMGYVNNTIGTYPNTNPFGYTYANQSKDALNRWRTNGDKAIYPAATTATNTAISNFIYYSSSNWGDASFIKLKTVSLNYSLPRNWLKKINFSSASIYAQGQNLFTWARQKYTYDPETSVPGADPGIGTGRYMSFPPMRTMVIGLNCSF